MLETAVQQPHATIMVCLTRFSVAPQTPVQQHCLVKLVPQELNQTDINSSSYSSGSVCALLPNYFN